MALRAIVFAVATTCSVAVHPNLLSIKHHNLRIPDVANGEIPTVGEEVGKQAGVEVPNPHAYTGALVGGGAAGVFVTIAIFCIASYYCYKWNEEIKAQKKEAHCGLLSVLCCLCCTPLVCCFPIDGPSDDKK